MKKLYILLFLLIAFLGNAQVLYDHYPLTGDQTRSSFNGGKWPYTNLKYYFANGSRHLSNAVAYEAVREAFYVWEERSTLTFTEVFSENSADIKISWATGDHGDGHPFDGNSSEVGGKNVLAHTSSPPPAGTRPSQLHFDDDENWTTGGMFGIDLTTTAIHEIGHALGLGHSDVTPSIMQANYLGMDQNLYNDDLQAIWNLYGRPYPIVGPTAVLAPTTITYSIGNTLPPGATVTWSTYPANSATIQSGQGTGTAKFTVTSNAFLGVDATIIFRSGRRWQCNRLNVAASIMPVVSDIEVFQYMQGPGEYTLKAIVSDPTATCTWSSSDGQILELPYPDDALFIDHPNLYKAVEFYSTGDHSVSVYARNASGRSSTYSKTIHVTNAKSAYIVDLSPNPATSGYVNIQVRKQDLSNKLQTFSTTDIEPYKVELWSGSGLINSWTTNQPNLQIPLTGLVPGYYFLHVIAEGNRYKQVLIIQ